MRRHADRPVDIDDSNVSGTVPRFTATRPVRPDMDQLQLQLQQRLSQQRVRNEHSVDDWRHSSDYGMSVDAQAVRAPAPSSRYSAPPTASVLIKTGPTVRPVDKMAVMCFPPSSQHAAAVASSPSSSSFAVTKPGQPLPTAVRTLPAGVGSGSCAPTVTSSATVVRSSPNVTSQHLRSETPYEFH